MASDPLFIPTISPNYSRLTGFGGIFRDCQGKVCGAFASLDKFPSSITSKVLPAIEAFHVAWFHEWYHIWLETNSTLVLHYLSSHSDVS